MRFKTGLLVGFGAGYVLGARAGRERYEQIRAGWDRVAGSPTVQRAVDKTSDLASQQGKRAFSVVQQRVEKAGSAVKEKLGKGPTDETWAGPAPPDTAQG